MNPKFVAGGLLIVAAFVYLLFSTTQANAQYFMTVDELMAKPSLGTRDVRVSGAVIGDSIEYDPETLTLRFTVAHLPGDNNEIEAMGGLAQVLHNAVIDPTATHMDVIYIGVKPDLLRNEAQAIMTGKLDSDGVFHATELLLKCPTKYEEAVPDQAQPGS